MVIKGSGSRWATILLCMLLSIVTAVSSAAEKKEKKAKEKKPAFMADEYPIYKQNLELKGVEAEFPAAQKKGGVRIELSPMPLSVEPRYTVAFQPRKTVGGMFFAPQPGAALPVWMGVLPFYQMNPAHAQMRIRINNQLSRVLRLQGVVVQFSKDGKAVPTVLESEINKAIVLPEQSWEGILEGPSVEAFGLQAVSAKSSAPVESTSVTGNLLVGLYEVVTAMDDASNPTERSKFEWLYTYTTQRVQETGYGRWFERSFSEAQQRELAGTYTAEQLGPKIGVTLQAPASAESTAAKKP
jgi:hypothetical protein